MQVLHTINVNSGEKGVLKCYQEFKVTLLQWIWCNNRLSFKHLIPPFPCVAKLDSLLLNFWEFFHYHFLATALLEKCVNIYGDCTVVSAFPSVTRETEYERACEKHYEKYYYFLNMVPKRFSNEIQGHSRIIQNIFCSSPGYPGGLTCNSFSGKYRTYKDSSHVI